jgi:hypothetical protein
MNVSLGRPCARYDAAAVRSPRASASRYERTTAAARSSGASGAGGFTDGTAVEVTLGNGNETVFELGLWVGEGSTATRAGNAILVS